MRTAINSLLFIGFLGLFTVGTSLTTHLYQNLRSDPDFWWTPPSMALPLDEARDRFEVLVRGAGLQERLESGDLLLRQADGTLAPLTPADLAVRLNNWRMVQALRLQYAVGEAFVVGGCVVLVIWGFLRRREERRKAA